jgi:hypothetical protein
VLRPAQLGKALSAREFSFSTQQLSFPDLLNDPSALSSRLCPLQFSFLDEHPTLRLYALQSARAEAFNASH